MIKKLIKKTLPLLAIVMIVLFFFVLEVASSKIIVRADLIPEGLGLDDRYQKDTNEAKEDAERLKELQEQDQKECENEVRGGTGGASPTLPGGTGAVSSFSAVPVREVGALLTSTRQIEDYSQEMDETTKSIEELTVHICMYLKSIQRIQTAFEQKEFQEDPALRREAATQVEDYKGELLGEDGLIQTGYDKTGAGPDAPLYPENLNTHLGEVEEEATQKYLEILENSDDEFKDETLAILKQSQGAYTPKSTISRDNYDRLMEGESFYDSDDFWSTFVGVHNPAFSNNPQTSFINNNNHLGLSQSVAREQAILEYNAGQGYLPIRECVDRSDDGFCRQWKTITPGIQVKDSASKALNYRLDLYTDAKQGDLAPGNEPQVLEIKDQTPAQTGGGAKGPGSEDLESIIYLLSQFGSQYGYQPTNDEGGGGSSFTPEQILELIIEYGQKFIDWWNGSRETKINMDLAITSLADINTGQPNQANISWQASGVSSCRFKNSWLSSNPTSDEKLDIVDQAGSNAEDQGERTINLPLQFNVRFIRERAGNQESLPLVSKEINEQLTYSSITIDMPPTSETKMNDVFYILFSPYRTNRALGPSGISIKISGVSASAEDMVDTFVTSFNQATGAQKAELDKYDFSFNRETGKIIITPKRGYEIECTTFDDRTITKKIELQR